MSARARARAARAGLSAAALAATAAPASAHLVQTGFGAFYDGAAHVVIAPEDLLVVSGLGLLAGLLGKRDARGVVLALPGGWLVGGLVAGAVAAPDALAWVLAAATVLVGALVAARVRVPYALLLGLAALLGALLGFAGAAVEARGDALALAGAVLAALTLTSLVAAFVVSLRAAWTRVAVRVAGSWIAAIGLLMLGWLARPGG